jgi:hypothetical protein
VRGKGVVYVIKSDTDGLVKIGKTTNAVKRFQSIESSTGRRIEQSYSSPETERFSEIETELHRKFKERRTCGEWFEISFEEAKGALDTMLARKAEISAPATFKRDEKTPYIKSVAFSPNKTSVTVVFDGDKTLDDAIEKILLEKEKIEKARMDLFGEQEGA